MSQNGEREANDDPILRSGTGRGKNDLLFLPEIPYSTLVSVPFFAK
jgi:hypothetical protein